MDFLPTAHKDIQTLLYENNPSLTLSPLSAIIQSSFSQPYSLTPSKSSVDLFSSLLTICSFLGPQQDGACPISTHTHTHTLLRPLSLQPPMSFWSPNPRRHICVIILFAFSVECYIVNPSLFIETLPSLGSEDTVLY